MSLELFPHQHRLDRRKLLALAGLGGAAWLTRVAQVLAGDDEQQSPREPARSIILLWLGGGPSQLETFDPHPGKKIAGGTRAIETSARGIQLAAGFEHLAEQMEHVSLIRSLTSKEGDHERGTHLVKTGYRPDPTVEHPALGAIVCHQLPGAGAEIPRHISILPANSPSRGGYLGAMHDAFQTGDPRGPLPDVEARVDAARLERRYAGLEVVERAFESGRQASSQRTLHAETIAAARKMMTSEQLQAFNTDDEPADVQRRYGNTPFGRGCLAARRLIEVGVRCVEVNLNGWDSHVDNHQVHARLVGELDPAFAALLGELRQRDLLRKTIVLCGGEFGRTPTMNSVGGRDHWPHNFAFALAGGGIRGGLAIGASDPEGGEKVDDPQPVANLHATVLSALGIDHEREIMTPIGRPLKLTDAGKPIRALVG